MFPIVGVNTVAHINAMPDALRVELSKEDIDAIHEAAPYDPGFPMSFYFSWTKPQKYDLSLTAANHNQIQMGAWIDVPPKQQVSTYLTTILDELKLTTGSLTDPGLAREVACCQRNRAQN